jgi:hypothetical protein
MYAGIENAVSAEDRASIEALLSEFYWRLDHKDSGSIAELFVEGGSLVTPAATVTGHEGITKWFTQRTSQGERITRHGWSNLRLSRAEGDRVRAEAHVRTVAARSISNGESVDIMFGETVDLLVKGPRRGWLFESRRLDVVLQRSIAGGPP